MNTGSIERQMSSMGIGKEGASRFGEPYKRELSDCAVDKAGTD